MTYKTCAIVVTNRPGDFRECVRSIAKQTSKFQKVWVVPWGGERPTVERIANEIKENYCIDIEMVDPGTGTTLEANRNLALKEVKKNPPDFVAFLDDDTVIDRGWLSRMAAEGRRSSSCAFASVVRFAPPYNHLIQSAGHSLYQSRPLDCAYRHPVAAIGVSDDPLCPCGNSALVPWQSIVSILRLDPEIWDPNFGQFQTCFDFGLKLRLVGTSCRLVRGALATHEGGVVKKALDERGVLKELRARILLYEKFYPSAEKEEAMGLLREKVSSSWKEAGYPSCHQLRGNDVKLIFEEAQRQAKDLAKRLNTTWLRKMRGLKEAYRRSLLFDGSTLRDRSI